MSKEKEKPKKCPKCGEEMAPHNTNTPNIIEWRCEKCGHHLYMPPIPNYMIFEEV